MFQVSIKAKRCNTATVIGLLIGISKSMLSSPAGAAFVDLKKLLYLTHQYLKKCNIKSEDIYLQCKKGLEETEELHLDNWEGVDALLKTKAALILKDVGSAPKGSEEEKKQEVKKDFPHVPDAKGFCKHCFRKLNKKNEGLFCREAMQDWKDEHASDKRKAQIEQEAEGQAYANYTR
jgi:hypothetical protein